MAAEPCTVRAWLLPLRGGVRAAAAEHELLEVIPRPAITPAAGAGEPGSLPWRDRALPVMDPAAPFHRDPGAPVPWLVVTLIVPDADGIGFGAVPLAAPPEAVTVDDGLACEPPDATLLDHLVWSQFAVSAFRHGGEPVPILDFARIFSAAGRQRLARYAGTGSPALPEEHA